MLALPSLGQGIGLRTPHYEAVLTDGPDIGWFEVISENFMVEGGNPRRVLQKVRERYPVVMHGVSLDLGSTDPLDEAYLDRLAALAEEVEPAWISDHLCWGSHAGQRAHDLWPLPFTEEALAHVAGRVLRVQDRLGRRLMVENVSAYLSYPTSEMTEWDFLGELVKRADCGLLVDVNNIYVSARNLGFDAAEFVDALPAERIAQIHLAGHSDRGTHLLDTHDHPVAEPVWDLYRRLVARAGRIPTLIEWDDHIPPLADLLAESRRAAVAEGEALAVVQRGAA